MAIAKMKLFKGSDPEKLEADINKWLSELSDREVVQRSETAITAVGTPVGQAAIVVISVWYVELSN
jgi:hypothetical protein